MRSELADMNLGHFEGAVEAHEHLRSQLSDRTNLAATVVQVGKVMTLVEELAQFSDRALGISPSNSW